MESIRPFARDLQAQIDFTRRKRNHGYLELRSGLRWAEGTKGLFRKFFDQLLSNTRGGEATIMHNILHGDHAGEI